jgi:hypothetical protein
MSMQSILRALSRRAALPIAIAGVLLATAGPAAAATTWQVTNTGDPVTPGTCPSASNCTLRAAILASADGDTINVPSGHIALNSSNGALAVNTSITIAGAGESSTTVDGGNATRVFHVIGPGPSFPESTASLTLKDLTVTGGSVTRNPANNLAGGAGIQNDSSGTLRLVRVAVTNNVFTASSVGSFQTEIGGAGIFSLATVALTQSNVSHNLLTITGAQGESGGGGVFVTGGDLIVADSSISNNTANITEGSGTFGHNGGGAVALDSQADDLIIENSTFDSNAVHFIGSELAADDGGGAVGDAAISILASGTTFSNNIADLGSNTSAAGGGALLDGSGGSAYTDDTFYGNSVHITPAVLDQGGGAIYEGAGVASFASDTFSANSPGAGTGASIYDEDSRLVFTDTILSSGSASVGNCVQDMSNPGTVDDQGYNLYDDTANSCSLTATSDVHSATPGLKALANNGGITETVQLASGSPAIDAGDPTGCKDALGHGLLNDQRGVARAQPAAHRCDIGAYEAAPPTALTSVAGAVGKGTATLQGTAIDPDEISGTAHFQYGRTKSYGKTTASQAVQAFHALLEKALLKGLAPGTYHYRLVVVNPDGTANGSDSTFVVPKASVARPAVLTGVAKSIVGKHAKLTGELDGFGAKTKYQFQIGTSRKYGKKTKLKSAGSRNKTVSVSALIEGLKPGHTYHYRLVATNSAGRTVGPDQTFKTPGG